MVTNREKNSLHPDTINSIQMQSAAESGDFADLIHCDHAQVEKGLLVVWLQTCQAKQPVHGHLVQLHPLHLLVDRY